MTRTAIIREALAEVVADYRPGYPLPTATALGRILGVSNVAAWRHLRAACRAAGVAVRREPKGLVVGEVSSDD